uniref:Uncharacterized protein n=1 Tax=Siphoviridae sp. ctR1X1 TaxID=2826331 RepID=A0A8S5QM76_9CAUD|nr:MAG TPA: hypothetical protein [Siphoviridae sp. ctR1X1]
MERLIKWLKEKLTSLFRKKGDTVPAGIQVFDKKGTEIISITDRLTRIVGVKRFDTIEASGSVTLKLAKGQHIWYFLNAYTDANDVNIMNFTNLYDLIITDDTISWKLRSFAEQYKGRPCKIALIYGVM